MKSSSLRRSSWTLGEYSKCIPGLYSKAPPQSEFHRFSGERHPPSPLTRHTGCWILRQGNGGCETREGVIQPCARSMRAAQHTADVVMVRRSTKDSLSDPYRRRTFRVSDKPRQRFTLSPAPESCGGGDTVP